MAHLLILNLVFFIIPTCGAIAFAVIVLRILRSGEPQLPASPSSTKAHAVCRACDLARSA